MLRDAMDRIATLRTSSLPHRAGVAAVVLGAVGFASLLVVQSRMYLAAVRKPNLASFAEFTAAIREIIPDGLCPVAVKNPSVWLAFPEKDRCFATIENRFRQEAYADIDGKEYALVTRPNALPDRLFDGGGGYHLLGEMKNTPYGNLLIYYSGSDPRYLEMKPKRYEFFGELGGYTLLDSGDAIQ